MNLIIFQLFDYSRNLVYLIHHEKVSKMEFTKQIAKHLREVYFGVNWTWSNMKDNLADVTWQEATTKVHSLNTIAVLVYHTNYFIDAVTTVLRGGPLEAKDMYSFDCPPILSQGDWQILIDKTLANAETFATLIEQLSDERLEEIFVEERYGSYYRNLNGIIEHTHYHLGQIAVIKKIVREMK